MLKLIQHYHKSASQKEQLLYFVVFCWVGVYLLFQTKKKNPVAISKSCLSVWVLSDSHHPAYC